MRRGVEPACSFAAGCGLAALSVTGCGGSGDEDTRTATSGQFTTRAAPPSRGDLPAEAYERGVRAGHRKILLARDVVAVAAGDGRAAWIADGRVVVRAAGEAPRTIARPVPFDADQIAIGAARDGRPTVLLASSERPGPVRSMPADGSAPPTPLPFAVDGRADSAPGHRLAPVRALETVDTGESAPGSFGALQSTADGTRLIATRWTGDQRSHPWDVATFRASDGTLLERHHPADHLEGDWGVDVPDGRIFTDMRHVRVGQISGEGGLVIRLRRAAP